MPPPIRSGGGIGMSNPGYAVRMARPPKGWTLVRIPDRGRRTHAEESRLGPVVAEALIRTRCPRCGRPRGRPERFRFKDHISGRMVDCDRWENTCGHVDLYADVWREVRATEAANLKV